MTPKRRKRNRWASTLAGTGWGESTFAEVAWDKSRGAAGRWAVLGIVVGALIAFVANLPAAWVANAVAAATQQRLILADARGTLWSGSAVTLLTGGPQSRDASALPGRLEWTLAPRALGLELKASHACCLNGAVVLQIRPGIGRIGVTLLPTPGWVGQWPSAWLGGLGTPWNTLQLGGAVRLTSPGVTIESVQGRWRVNGRADIDLLGVSSRMTTLSTLGQLPHERFGRRGAGRRIAAQLVDPGRRAATQRRRYARPERVRFRGEARAAAADEPALNNLLNIIGRREGARSVISIG